MKMRLIISDFGWRSLALLGCGPGARLIARRSLRWTQQPIAEKKYMKAKMNLTRIWCALSIFVTYLSGSPQSRGQTLGNEIPVRTGFEPAVNCDHRGVSGRIQVVLMDQGPVGDRPNYPIYWEVSTDQGSTWSETPFQNTTETKIDPFATCDIWSNDTTRRMYFGWFRNAGGPDADFFLRSRMGTNCGSIGNCDNGPESIQGLVGNAAPDRPWLTGNSASLYLSFHVSKLVTTNPSSYVDLGYVQRAPIPSGTAPVVWSGTPQLAMSPSPTPAPSATPATTFVASFPVAAHADASPTPNETVYMIARQYVTSGCTETDQYKNYVRVKLSTDHGATWTSDDVLTVDVSGADGFVIGRDDRMVTEHISRDPNTSRNYVYAFYVRNQPGTIAYPQHNVLYSRSSINGGTSWNNEVAVLTAPTSPSSSFATEPANCSGDTSGFFRIGRVWSTVDDNGYVYVAWMDNRYGKYSATKDYWQVFCSRSTDQGATWLPPIQVSGTAGDLTTASIGGYGNPFATGDQLPPGDFLTCDADSNTLYVAWPDSRANQNGHNNAPTEVYFRYVQFQN